MFLSRNPLSRSPFSRTFFRTDPALPLMLFEDDGGSGGGTPKTPVVKENIDALVEAKVASILASNKAGGDKDEALKILARALHIQETRASTAETKLTDAQKSAPSEADATDLAAFRALGFKPEDLKTELETGKTAKIKNAETERLGELEKAAKALGLKPALLKRLAPAQPVISKEEDVKGEDGKFTKETRWFFKDGDKETEIGSFFADDEETLSLLKADSSGDGSGGAGTTQPPARRYIEQGSGGGKTKNTFEKIKERNEKAAEGEKPKSLLETAREAGMTT